MPTAPAPTSSADLSSTAPIEPLDVAAVKLPGVLQRTFRLRIARLGVAWTTALGIIAMHLVALLAIFPQFFHWSGVVLVPVLYYLAGALGICLGFHRLLTHRSFQTFKPVEYALTILGTLSWQGGPIRWVGTHRIHHAESDGPHDPHTPQHGFTWSHIFWCFYKWPDGRDPMEVTRDLQRDKGMVLIDRFHYVPQLILAAVLFALGWWIVGTWQAGVGWTVWGVAIRTVITYHATWFVNSAAHTWGYRNFTTDDGSRNNWWVALLSFGEGWHNNHHAQQRSAAHGMRWWEIDTTYWVILLMERVGLARAVVRPRIERMNQPET